jgi:hypothetical protein
LEPDDSLRLGVRKGGVSDILNHKWYESTFEHSFSLGCLFSIFDAYLTFCLPFADMDFDELIERSIEAPWKPDPVLDTSSRDGSVLPAPDSGIVDEESAEPRGSWLNSF